MERNAESPSTGSLWQEVKAVLISASFLYGTAILVGSAVVGIARDVPGILFLGLVGYLVAGLLAPKRPFVTAMLLGLVHATAFLAVLPEPSDPWAQMGQGFATLFFLVSIAAGMFVTGLVGHLVARWLKTGAR